MHCEEDAQPRMTFRGDRGPNALKIDYMLKAQLTPHEYRRLAVAACVDPRTLQMYADGRSRSTTSARIDAALLELGLGHLRADSSAGGADRSSKDTA
jgi:hypothetical protein